MEPLPGRRESNYYWDEEDRDEPLSQRQPTALPPPPSSSPSSSSSVRWGGGPRQMEYSTEEDHYHPPADSGSPSALFVEKEHMFDKVVTPSDVGKLNRLVIPKQHAEKYFPLDASAGEKGLLLSFEDRTGKQWRFRYSYWNSSQSYVMTKGWSRFVKEKRLDAGDTVSFGRGVGEAARHRLFIDWRHRPDALPSHPLLHCLPLRVHGHVPSPVFPFARSAVPWGRLVVPQSGPSVLPAMAAYDHLVYGHNSAGFSNPYLRSAGNPSQVAVQLGIGRGSGSAGEEEETSAPMVFDSVPLARSNAAARTVRLFGVNLGCSPSEANTGVHAATHGHAPPPALAPLQMRLGAPDVVEPPAGRDQQPAGFLDLAM